jgi:NAD(P)-dependent dehydrogenase (short-subunit alcohol dehydrogenase family)
MALVDRFDLTGKTALVTGSSRGIGRALVLGLAEQGANVVVHCVGNVDTAQQVVHEAQTYGVQAHAVQADLSHEHAAHDLFQQTVNLLGHLDILVLNAAVNTRKDWLEITREDYEWQMNVNFRSALELIQRAVPGMKDRNWGRVVTIGSIQQVKPLPGMLVYAASKCAQLNMVRNLAKQLGQHNITVNNLAPGVIVTDRNRDTLADPEYHQMVLDQIPVGFFGDAEDCVGALLLLCSEAGRYITGVDLFVDGGMQL